LPDINHAAEAGEDSPPRRNPAAHFFVADFGGIEGVGLKEIKRAGDVRSAVIVKDASYARNFCTAPNWSIKTSVIGHR
jgi:hypothetical protein